MAQGSNLPYVFSAEEQIVEDKKNLHHVIAAIHELDNRRGSSEEEIADVLVRLRLAEKDLVDEIVAKAIFQGLSAGKLIKMYGKHRYTVPCCTNCGACGVCPGNCNNSALMSSYLSQVLDETLRCAVVAPWAAIFQDFDSELGRHKIPKGTGGLKEGKEGKPGKGDASD